MSALKKFIKDNREAQEDLRVQLVGLQPLVFQAFTFKQEALHSTVQFAIRYRSYYSDSIRVHRNMFGHTI